MKSIKNDLTGEIKDVTHPRYNDLAVELSSGGRQVDVVFFGGTYYKEKHEIRVDISTNNKLYTIIIPDNVQAEVTFSVHELKRM